VTTPAERTAALRAPLFVPAHREAMVRKALEGRTGADALIIDLEDGVPVDSRAEAEAVMVSLADPGPISVPVYCRIRSGEQQWREDLELVPAWCAGVVLAKSESAATVAAVGSRLRERLPGARIWLLIESALGVELLPVLIGACELVDGVMLGGGDLRADLRARATGDDAELAYARSRLVVAAAAARIAHVVDTPEPAIQDAERLRRVSGLVRGLGFTGKACIHPSQLSVVREAFAPTAEETAWAQGVLGTGDGAQRVGGEMVDEATKRLARSILAEAG